MKYFLIVCVCLLVVHCSQCKEKTAEVIKADVIALEGLQRLFLYNAITRITIRLPRVKTVKLPPAAANALLLAVQQCMPQTGVSVDALLLIYQGGYSQDKKFKNFIYCCYNHAGYLTPDGRLDIEKSAKVFKNEPDVVESIRRCGEKTGENAKEALFNFFKCYQDTGSVRFSL